MPDRFTRIKIAGFRRLRDVDVPLRDLAVVIGPNGSGKTTLLEAWMLLAAAARGSLSDEISARGGFNEVMTRDSTSGIEIGVELSNGIDRIEHAIKLAPNGYGFRLDATRSRAGVEGLLGGTQLFRPIDVGPRSTIRLPQSLEPATSPGADGGTLAACLYGWRESDQDRFETVEDTLRAAFPGFDGLGFPAVAAGMLAMTWKEKSFSKPLYMRQLSEGTLRFLWLATLLASPDLPAVTLIDEPEVSLHPELLRLLLELMREASKRTQLIVATHSDRLVRFAKPDEVLVADIEDGAAKLTWADTMDLNHWLADYSLDELWSQGVIGGRPAW